MTSISVTFSVCTPTEHPPTISVFTLMWIYGLFYKIFKHKEDNNSDSITRWKVNKLYLIIIWYEW